MCKNKKYAKSFFNMAAKHENYVKLHLTIGQIQSFRVILFYIFIIFSFSDRIITFVVMSDGCNPPIILHSSVTATYWKQSAFCYLDSAICIVITATTMMKMSWSWCCHRGQSALNRFKCWFSRKSHFNFLNLKVTVVSSLILAFPSCLWFLSHSSKWFHPPPAYTLPPLCPFHLYSFPFLTSLPPSPSLFLTISLSVLIY